MILPSDSENQDMDIFGVWLTICASKAHIYPTHTVDIMRLHVVQRTNTLQHQLNPESHLNLHNFHIPRLNIKHPKPSQAAKDEILGLILTHLLSICEPSKTQEIKIVCSQNSMIRQA